MPLTQRSVERLIHTPAARVFGVLTDTDQHALTGEDPDVGPERPSLPVWVLAHARAAGAGVWVLAHARAAGAGVQSWPGGA